MWHLLADKGILLRGQTFQTAIMGIYSAAAPSVLAEFVTTPFGGTGLEVWKRSVLPKLPQRLKVFYSRQ
jgi:hypothetical protein